MYFQNEPQVSWKSAFGWSGNKGVISDGRGCGKCNAKLETRDSLKETEEVGERERERDGGGGGELWQAGRYMKTQAPVWNDRTKRRNSALFWRLTHLGVSKWGRFNLLQNIILLLYKAAATILLLQNIWLQCLGMRTQ